MNPFTGVSKQLVVHEGRCTWNTLIDPANLGS